MLSQSQQFLITLKVVDTYEEALRIVDPKKALGKPHKLWIKYAEFVEMKAQQLDKARNIYEKALNVEFRNIDDLASVYCAYAELELQQRYDCEAHRDVSDC